MRPYTVTVYYHGPQSAWAGKLNRLEVIHEAAAPWLWLARRLARFQAGNQGRCGYVISRDGEVVEQEQAPFPAISQVAS